jgi:uncharacterized membrane protein
VLLIDGVRGLAIAGVVLFHIVWDFEFTGLISGFAFHPIWLAFGHVLAGTFMFLVGVSLVLAHGREVRWRSFLKRVGIVALGAVIISIATWFAFPQNFIYFGILHAIAMASLVAIMFLRLPTLVTIAVALFFFLARDVVSSDAFNSRWLAWIGLFTSAPPSNDFVPVFPWFGLTLLGVAAARLVFGADGTMRSIPDLGNGLMVRAFVWMGRNSLVIYLVHQPVLLAIIVPVASLIRS